MESLNPMEIGDCDDFFDTPERFEVHDAKYGDYGDYHEFRFRIVFSPLMGLFCDVLNSEERYNIVKNEYKNNIELRDFNPVLILDYAPIIDRNKMDEEVISLSLGFMNRDGNEYADYTALFEDDDD